MEIVDKFVWLVLLGGALFGLTFAPRWGLLAKWRSWRRAQRRTQIEDALKHLLALSDRGQSGTAESLAEALGLKQREMAARLGINMFTYANYEYGRAMPPADIYTRILELRETEAA